MSLKKTDSKIRIIDLFAGPGGLGEGFSKFNMNGDRFFDVSLSVEKDMDAHNTLCLRSFFRQFGPGQAPKEYYQFLKGNISKQELYGKFPFEYARAEKKTWQGELGKIDEAVLDKRIIEALYGCENWILIGGPPCQAYSTVGRSRNKGILNYVPEKDEKHFLYKQYLRIIANHWPSVFIMENVRGILSSRIKGNLIFPKILEDLKNPSLTLNGSRNKKRFRYRIFSLVKKPDGFSIRKDPVYKNINDFTIKCEEYGVPQARHRVILMGIREDICDPPYPVLKKSPPVCVRKVIGGLPRLRSGFSKGEDSKERWLKWLDKIIEQRWYRLLQHNSELEDVAKKIFNANFDLSKPRKDRGGEFIPYNPRTKYLRTWFHDNHIQGVCNSSTRAHLDSDLHRYFYAACFAAVKNRSPLLAEFPKELLPDHKSAKKAIESRSLFSDRFRVQVKSKPSTTIMSHISKDGHYYIHYDPTQCRSLTVREAARLQTFPDNYFFCGSRTQQYIQVGNAVPPYLAYQIAEIVYHVISNNKADISYGQNFRNQAQLEHVTD